MYRIEKSSVPLGPPEAVRGRRSPSTGGWDLSLQRFWLCRALWKSILMRGFLPWNQGTGASLYTMRLVGDMGLNLLHILQAPNLDHRFILRFLLQVCAARSSSIFLSPLLL